LPYNYVLSASARLAGTVLRKPYDESKPPRRAMVFLEAPIYLALGTIRFWLVRFAFIVTLLLVALSGKRPPNYADQQK
jgi:hypothetical protein